MTGSANPVAPERWHIHGATSQLEVAGRWEDILAATHVPFDVRFTHRTPGGFSGTVLRRRLGELTLVDCACLPFSGHHIGEAAGPTGAAIGFQMVRKGAERVRFGSAERVVLHGEAALWDGSLPVDIEVVEPFVKRTLIFPRDRVLSVCPRIDDHALLSLDPNPSVRLLARYVDALADELPVSGQPDSTTDAAVDVALELLRAAVEPALPSGRAAAREAMRASVRRYVRLHLCDPTLRPAAIARAHAVSLRSLHTLFENTGESVAGYIRRSRLARCRADLERAGTGTVGEIAFRWGFRDAAHFSTVFKREYGLSPRELRRDAADRARGEK